MTGRRWVWPAAITAVYAIVVIWAASHHEPWRDEVVPLSIARAAHSFSELVAPLRFEGHPIGWYALLWVLDALIGKAWVLKAASVGSAIGAVFLLNRSRLPWWLLALFTFSFFPLYQYSVVSRGYGLEMLVLFGLCTIFPHRRGHPIALGLVLAALANTEAFGAIIAIAVAGMVVVEAAMVADARRRLATDRAVWAGAAVFAAGLLFALWVAFPAASHRGTGIHQLGAVDVALGIGHAILQPVAHSTGMATLPVPTLWIFAYFVYLVRTPPLLAFVAVALIGMEALFNLAHGPSAAWHIGHVFLVLIAALWLDASGSIATLSLPTRLEHGRVWLGRILMAGLCVVLAQHVSLGAARIMAETRYDYSANRRFGELLHANPAWDDAVVMGDPDGPLWSLPYYAGHRVYLAREATYRAWGVYAPPRRVAFDLSELLATARRVHSECACPVVLTLGYDVGQLGIHTRFKGTRFEETFEITARARDEFLAATKPIARSNEPTITDEHYDVFVLR
ncbi:MAG: hypothetical protein ABIR79_22620 [Candidatus Binatia bacterium]